jgi:hypothetical protein
MCVNEKNVNYIKRSPNHNEIYTGKDELFLNIALINLISCKINTSHVFPENGWLLLLFILLSLLLTHRGIP